jgi:lysozyme
MTKNKMLIDMLARQEGKRKFAYECTAGKISIGIGRNLEDRGLSDDEIMFLLNNDIEISQSELSKTFDWFSSLNQARQDALVSMHFNIGLSSLLKFTNTLQYLSEGNFKQASQEMLDSKWASQVGNRAIELSEIIRTGKYVTS